MKRLLRKIRLFDVIAILLFTAGCTFGVPVIPDLPDVAKGSPGDVGVSTGGSTGGGSSSGGPGVSSGSSGGCSRGNSDGGGSCSGLKIGDHSNPHFDGSPSFGRTGNPGFDGTGNPNQS